MDINVFGLIRGIQTVLPMIRFLITDSEKVLKLKAQTQTFTVLLMMRSFIIYFVHKEF